MPPKRKEVTRKSFFSSSLQEARREFKANSGQPKLQKFEFLKSFADKIQRSPGQEKKITAQVTQLYHNHPDYSVTQKEVQSLLPNMTINATNKALAVFGISIDKDDQGKESYKISPLPFIYAMLLNSCNDLPFEEKIRFAFNMYDQNQDGYLCKSDVENLLAYQNRENGLGLQRPVLQEMVEAIFEEIDKDQSGQIDLQEFSEFFSRFKDKKITLSARKKRLAVGDDETLKGGQVKMTPKRKFVALLKIEGSKYFWIFMYCVGLALSGWWYWHSYCKDVIERGFAKMFAGMICYNLALIVLMINKSFISFLRVIPFLPRFFPINKNVVFHKYMAVIMMICAVGHMFSHLCGTFILFQKTPIEVLNTVLYSPMEETPSYAKLLFGSVPGLTGIALAIGFPVIIMMARQPIRAKNYERFWHSHHIYIVMFILLHIHGMKAYVTGQTYWKWLWGPGLFLLSEKVFKYIKAVINRYEILNIQVNSDVVFLQLKRPRTFMYAAGQFAMICVPYVSKFQWHSITISSCPSDPTITFHISIVSKNSPGGGYWTNGLAQLARDYKEGKISKLPTVRLDGPWGAPSQHYEDFKHLVIVSSGIGATPFCSILKEILLRLKSGDKRLKFTKIDFFWINRKPQNTTWLNQVLIDLRAESVNEAGEPLLDLHIYYTGAYEKYDFRSFMIWNGFQFMKDKGRLTSDKMANYDCMYWGRPDWEANFASIANAYKKKKVGVFMCANKMLCNEVYEKCVKYSDVAKFIFYKENFG